MFLPHSRGCLSDDLREACPTLWTWGGGGGGGDLSDDLVHLRGSLSDFVRCYVRAALKGVFV